MSEMANAVTCPLNLEEKKCTLRPCKDCGFFPPENDRRKLLPLIKLDNGLYGKRVGSQHRTTEA